LGATNIGEERCARAARYRVSVEAVFVHQAKPDERLDEPHTAVGQDFAARLGLKAGNLLCHLSACDPDSGQRANSRLFEKTTLGVSFMRGATGSVDADQVSAIVS
jgi:hypothetical protein